MWALASLSVKKRVDATPPYGTIHPKSVNRSFAGLTQISFWSSRNLAPSPRKLWDNFTEVSLFVSVSLSSSVALSVALDSALGFGSGCIFPLFLASGVGSGLSGVCGQAITAAATNKSIASIEAKIVFLPVIGRLIYGWMYATARATDEAT